MNTTNPFRWLSAALRVAGETTESVGRELHRHLAVLADLLGDDPWAGTF